MFPQNKKGYAFFLVGCTATGKTAVAQYIAEKFEMEILSADAMLVYKGMDIGTAKPDKTMQQKVRYWGLDLVAPNEQFNLAKYVSYVKGIINKVDKSLIVVGGSGLYIKALLCGLDNLKNLENQTSIRAYAEKLFKDNGIEALQNELRSKSPELFQNLKDKSNPRRLIRALEMAILQNNRIERTWDQKEQPQITGLFIDREVLKRRIANRTKAIFSSGIIDEAKRLLDLIDTKQHNVNFTALQAIGYKEAIEFIKGDILLEEAINKTITRTAQLAKKQMTWFRHQANVEWVEIGDEDCIEKIADSVLESWRRIGPAELALK